MLAQNSSQTFMTVLLTCVLSLFSLNAISGGTKQIYFLQKDGTDTDRYTVTAMWDAWGSCVERVWPWSVNIVRGYEQVINIDYLSTVHYCGVKPSTQLFKVQSEEHPERVAQFWWRKEAGKSPYAWTNKAGDPKRLLWIDNSDGGKIKVWVSYIERSR